MKNRKHKLTVARDNKTLCIKKEMVSTLHHSTVSSHGIPPAPTTELTEALSKIKQLKEDIEMLYNENIILLNKQEQINKENESLNKDINRINIECLRLFQDKEKQEKEVNRGKYIILSLAFVITVMLVLILRIYDGY